MISIALALQAALILTAGAVMPI